MLFLPHPIVITVLLWLYIFYFRYFRHEPVIQHIKRVSKPGLRRYAAASEMKLVRGGLGLMIVSTPEGVITSKEAKKRNVGGELLVEIW